MASALEIHRVDPFDNTTYDAWWDAYAEARRADLGENAVVWSREESRAELQQDSATTRRQAFVAMQDGIVSGIIVGGCG